MSRLVLIGVEMVGGKPDLQLPAGTDIRKTGPGIFTVSWGQHAMSVYNLGTLSGKRWFLGSATRQIATGLAHLGANVKLASGIMPAQRAAILALSGLRAIHRASDDAIVGVAPPVVLAGMSALAAGLDGIAEVGESYYLGEATP